jgi:L-ascorbate metabolism protein UlaG (beta-lactamase superfamily)
MKLGNINLEWKGQSGFFLDAGKKIYIDPFKLTGGEKADLILITHSHYDHCSIEDLKKIVKNGTIVICSGDCCSKFNHMEEKIDLKVIEPGQGIQIEKIKIIAVPAYNVNNKGHDKAEYWNGYIVEIEGLRIYHAGDTDLIPEMSRLGKIDVALLPVGGTYTMDVNEAVKAASIIKPGLAVPMHFGSIVGSREDGLRFQELCKKQGIKAEVMEIS